MKEILFIAPMKSSFIKKDLDILKQKYKVSYIEVTAFSFINVFLSQIKLLIKILLELKKKDLYFIWFADYHSFLPVLFAKLFKKKSIIVIGGSDVNYLPEYGIGNVVGPLGIRKFSVIYSLNNASLLLPVDESLIYTENSFANQKKRSMGIQHFSKNKNIKVLPTAVDLKQWKTVKKKNQFMTIISFSNKKRLIQKGFDLFLEIAKELSDYDFYLVGGKKSVVEKSFEIPENLEVLEFLNHDELSKLLSETKVFVLLSISEGMPNVLIEAMASGCIPVVSNVNGMPRVAEEHGYILKEKKIDLALKLCKSALNEIDEVHKKIENDIKNKFKLKFREEKLVNIIEELI